MKQFVKFCKDFLLFYPLSFLFRPFERFFLFISYFNRLVSWISRNKKQFISSDHYSPVREYAKRYTLYQFIIDHYQQTDKQIVYLEFGVAGGDSFNWWLSSNRNTNSRFFGFDTFEGLPEKWGSFYEKGDMSFAMPQVKDQRGKFVKGLFQDSLPGFITENQELLNSNAQKLIHMDADLYSATIFTLSQLYPTLHKGDIILFDEFSVAMHEFKAFIEFTGNFYINLKPIVAVNNFYQVGFEVV
ncbi:MAG: TylF/MycF/NovP-related O-methyltransferase [Sediminibacterium sp.]